MPNRRMAIRPAMPDAEVILRAAMRLISEELAAMPPLAVIAERVGVTENRLSAIFRQQLGVTVFVWIREERLRQGRRLLADTALDVQEIASAVGFRGAGNFSTAFRERHGFTPSRYREELRAGHADAETAMTTSAERAPRPVSRLLLAVVWACFPCSRRRLRATA